MSTTFLSKSVRDTGQVVFQSAEKAMTAGAVAKHWAKRSPAQSTALLAIYAHALKALLRASEKFAWDRFRIDVRAIRSFT